MKASRRALTDNYGSLTFSTAPPAPREAPSPWGVRILALRGRAPAPILSISPRASRFVEDRSCMTQHEGSPTPFARVMRWVRADRNDVLLVVLYAVISAVVALSIPITVQAMVNTVAFGALLQPMIVLALLVFAGLAAAALFRALQVRVVETIQERVFARTALQLSHRLPHLDSSVFDEAHGPELVNRFFDVVTVQKAASVLLVDGSALALQTLVGMIV
ncbi:MAG: hypothetical protein EOP08_09815, partial [Proteobacteria bacterium]